jgi:Fic family protein
LRIEDISRRSARAGHRNAPVFTRASRHVPPPLEALTDAMSALLDTLESEPEAIVRAVMGYWRFGFIHPHTDGNGRHGSILDELDDGFHTPWSPS